MHKYHLIDLLRASKFTFPQQRIQKLENYRYTFDLSQFLYKNGLYIVIILIFIALCIITPIVKNTQLFTVTNILNILQQASPRMFLALGVAGLILLTGTDLSVGRMVGMGMVTATIIMHNGINTGAVFGHVFDFSAMPATAKALFALLMCVIFTTVFAMIAGFFMARFKMHPFISTMAVSMRISASRREIPSWSARYLLRRTDPSSIRILRYLLSAAVGVGVLEELRLGRASVLDEESLQRRDHLVLAQQG
jgi:methyl-galactoside transport system permease protein